MTAPFRPSFNPAPKILDRHVRRQEKDAAENTELTACYKAVDLRDENRCRACGHQVSPNGGMFWAREHNHLQKRSTAERVIKNTRKNIHLACRRCHNLITNDKIRIIGRNCDQPLAFVWSPHATPGERKGIRLRDERAGRVTEARTMTQQNSHAAVEEVPTGTNAVQQPEPPEQPAATSQGDGDGGGAKSEIHHGDGEDDSA